MVNQSYPVKNGQVHPHVESASGEVDPLWDIREHHVVEGLHREGVPALKGNTKQTEFLYITARHKQYRYTPQSIHITHID